MSDKRNRTMDLMMNMQRNAWRERQPTPTKPVDETVPMYNIADIYDNPGPHMTVRGMFRYTGVDVIS